MSSWDQMRALRGLALPVCLTLGLTGARGEDWYRFRGPDLNGISQESGWRTEWPKEGPKILWKAAVGLGYSSVAISRGRVFTMGNENDTDTVYCFAADTGREMWTHAYACKTNPKWYQGGTSSTPTVDGDVVYVLSREGHLFALEAAGGRVRWSKNIAGELGLELSDWGFAGSPLVLGEKLILNAGTRGVAVRKSDGSVIWSTGKEKAGFASPVPFTHRGTDAVLIFAAEELAAVTVDDGKVLWSMPWETKYEINAADPVVVGDRIFISSGYRSGGGVVSVAGTEPQLLWKNQNMHNQLNASVSIGGYLYGISGQNGHEGDLRCVALESGEVMWKEPSAGLGALMAAEGKLIVQGEKGELIIAEASPKAFKPLARAQVLGGTSWTAPVLSNGRIYCRNAKGTLVCVDVMD